MGLEMEDKNKFCQDISKVITTIMKTGNVISNHSEEFDDPYRDIDFYSNNFNLGGNISSDKLGTEQNFIRTESKIFQN